MWRRKKKCNTFWGLRRLQLLYYGANQITLRHFSRVHVFFPCPSKWRKSGTSHLISEMVECTWVFEQLLCSRWNDDILSKLNGKRSTGLNWIFLYCEFCAGIVIGSFIMAFVLVHYYYYRRSQQIRDIREIHSNKRFLFFFFFLFRSTSSISEWWWWWWWWSILLRIQH